MFTDACSTWIKSIYIIQYSHLFAFFASFGDIVVHEYQEFRALGLLSSPTCRYRIPPRPSLQPPTVNEGTQAVTTWPNARYLDGHTTLNHPSRGWLGLLHIYIYIVYYTYIYIYCPYLQLSCYMNENNDNMQCKLYINMLYIYNMYRYWIYKKKHGAYMTYVHSLVFWFQSPPISRPPQLGATILWAIGIIFHQPKFSHTLPKTNNG